MQRTCAHYAAVLAQIAFRRAVGSHLIMTSKLAWASSADKSAGEATTVIAFYNIGWQQSRFNQIKRHEKTLAADLQEAIDKH